MKITVVPAQITTVEDRITANLSISQLMLFVVPMFFGAFLYWVVPSSIGSEYKLVIITMLTLMCLIMAIRINGKIVLSWLILIVRYNIRPKFYIFDKRTTANREDYPRVSEPMAQTVGIKEQTQPVGLPRLGLRESAYLYSALNDPMSRLNFETNKKGVLNVRITEVQE